MNKFELLLRVLKRLREVMCRRFNVGCPPPEPALTEREKLERMAERIQRTVGE